MPHHSQLSRAKDRLAKMEEIIVMINQVKHSGQNVRDVIPPDYLAILEEAEVRWRGWGRQGERKVEVGKERGREI